MSKSIRWAVVGLGGYAGSMADQLLEFVGKGAEIANGAVFVAACDPQLSQGEKANHLRSVGVKVVEQFDEILAMPDVDAVWLPLPIQLHRPFTEKALKAGKAVLCEKPAAGSIQDVNAMIRARDAAKLPVAIGFQDIYDSAIQEAKRRILAGEIGEIVSASVMACWPRSQMYYDRSVWAGRIGVDGIWVLDSPANNALAHPINVALFMMGGSEAAWGQPIAVAAELYRANKIENYDTCSIRATVGREGSTTGVPLLVLMTHACRQTIHPVIEIVGTRGSVHVPLFDNITIQHSDSPDASPLTIRRSKIVRIDMLHHLGKFFAGEKTNIVIPTIETARPHSLMVNGASAACAVRDIPPGFVVHEDWSENDPGRAVPGIEEAFIACAAKKQMIHESGTVAWSEPAETLSLVDFERFDGPPVA